nr:MAG TPA: hypothetical protein [Caudoviricetes sp.]
MRRISVKTQEAGKDYSNPAFLLPFKQHKGGMPCTTKTTIIPCLFLMKRFRKALKT